MRWVCFGVVVVRWVITMDGSAGGKRESEGRESEGRERARVEHNVSSKEQQRRTGGCDVAVGL